MICSHQHLQLLCQFKIAMRRQSLLVDLESFVYDSNYRKNSLNSAQKSGCAELVRLASDLQQHMDFETNASVA